MPAENLPDNTPPMGLSAEEGAEKLLTLLPDTDTKSKEPGAKPDADKESEGADDQTDDKSESDDADDDLPLDDEDEESTDDDTDADDTDAADDDKEFLFTVEDENGKEIRVDLEEAKRGYLRTQDYTRKRQKESKERDEAVAKAEAEQAELAKRREDYAKKLEILDEALGDEKEPDWEKSRKELQPADFAALHAEWEIRKSRRQALKAERQRVEKERQDDFVAEAKKRIEVEQRKLREAIPDLADKAKGPELQKALYAYAEADGVTPEELHSVPDHRIIKWLHKARLYDRAVARKRELKAKPKSADGKVLKPGARRDRATRASVRQKEAQARLRKSGSIEDAAAALLDFKG